MTGRQPADWALMERRNIAGTSLGGLEAELLEHLWAAGEPLGTRELAGMLQGSPRAYTTIVTVLTRLVGKGLVERIGDGRRYLYRAAGDPDQLTARAIERLLAAAADRRAVLAHLVEGSQDPGCSPSWPTSSTTATGRATGRASREPPAVGRSLAVLTAMALAVTRPAGAVSAPRLAAAVELLTLAAIGLMPSLLLACAAWARSPRNRVPVGAAHGP